MFLSHCKHNHESKVSRVFAQLGDGGGVAEAELQRFLFVGNHAAAVDTCVASERYADALVIAHISGLGDLWRDTLGKYMQACPHPYLRVVDSQACPSRLSCCACDGCTLCARCAVLCAALCSVLCAHAALRLLCVQLRPWIPCVDAMAG